MFEKSSPSGAGASAACNKDGTLCVATSDGAMVALGREVRPARGADSCAAISTDGRLIANGTIAGDIQLRDAELNMLRSLGGLHASPVAIAFSPDRRYIAASDDAAFLHVWELSNGRGWNLESRGKIKGIVWTGARELLAVGLARYVLSFGVDRGERPVFEWRQPQPRPPRLLYFEHPIAAAPGVVAVYAEDEGILFADFNAKP